jgi:hypothetical protein
MLRECRQGDGQGDGCECERSPFRVNPILLLLLQLHVPQSIQHFLSRTATTSDAPEEPATQCNASLLV